MFRIMMLAMPLLLSPMAATAMCSDHQAMSCAEGMVWDSESHSCVKQVSS